MKGMRIIMKKINIMWKYVIFSYLLFWTMVIALGGTASLIFKVSPLTMRWIANICAWSPTIAFLIMFKKLRPETSLKDFYKSIFSGKIRIDLLVISGITVVGSVFISIYALSIFSEREFFSFFSMGAFSFPLTVLLSFLSGPTGEETGWRGYLRVELDKKYGFYKASIIGGLIWAFWHAVLWFIDSDFSGFALIIYIVSNVVVMTSLVIIMNYVLKRSDNLINAIWIHFCFNLIYNFLIVEIDFYIIMTIIFALVGILFILLEFNSESKNKILSPENVQKV
jgi:membrane protease YdiL (CAAX protease family)